MNKENDIKVVYVTHARLPTQKAHGRAIVKLCEAFERAGVEVDLIIPKLWFVKRPDIYSYYGVRENFSITELFALDLGFLKIFERATYPLRFISFSKIAAWYCAWKYRDEKRRVIYFSHDAIALYFLSFISKDIFYDIHDFPSDTMFGRAVMKKARGFSVQTRSKIPFLKKHFGASEEKIVYWPNGTDIQKFQISKPKLQCRKELGLPQDKKITLYTGQLFGWKGVDTFIRASQFLPDVECYIVGGTQKDVSRTRREVKESGNANVRFVNFQPHEQMPLWLRAADVLVLPNTGREDVSRYWTSPMKLFEYMASGTPIVASRLPSLEEIIDEDTAFFAEADNPKSFAEAIQKAMHFGTEKGSHAQERAQQYTWHARAEKILEHMRVRLSSGA